MNPGGARSRIEILTIGDELLDGRVADTNTLRIAAALAALGEELAARTSVRDDREAILRAAREVMARGTTTCFVSGGLGPTLDDLTTDVFAELAGVEVSTDPEQAERIVARVARRGRTASPNQLRQAHFPGGAELVANPVGLALGWRLAVGRCAFVALPGVPVELEAMLPAAVEPLRSETRRLEQRLARTFGLMEAEVDARLQELPGRWPEVRLGFRAAFPEIHVTLLGPADGEALGAACAWTAEQLGEALYGWGDGALPERVVRALSARGETLAVAEACTGGALASLVTDVPGASAVFLEGVVAYADAAKTRRLGVGPALLVEHGAVSEACVRELAASVRAASGATWGVAVSGIAGPGGGTAEKPAGTVWLAVCGATGTEVRRLYFPFDRARYKLLAAWAAVALLRQFAGVETA